MLHGLERSGAIMNGAKTRSCPFSFTVAAADTPQWVSLSGADPLNLVGILTPGPKLPGLASNRLLYRDGIPTAVLIGNDIQFLETLDDAKEWIAQKKLLRGPVQSPPLSPVAAFGTKAADRMIG